MTHWVIGSGGRPLEGSFLTAWLGNVLCPMFAVGVATRGSKFVDSLDVITECEG